MKNFITYCLLLFSISLVAQDVHFTQFTFAPQSVNPSLIGGYSGTYRVSGILRTQQYGGDISGFNTGELNIDAPIIKGFRDQDWIGVGAGFNQWQAGQFRYTETLARLGVSYHIGLDKKSNSYFSIGAQMLNTSRQFRGQMGTSAGFIVTQLEDSDLRTFLMAQGAGGGGSGSGNQGPSNNTRDVHVGISYTAKSKTGNFKIGLSSSQFLRDNVTIRARQDDPIKFIGFFQMYRIINKRLAIEPAVIFQNIFRGQGFEISAHNMFSYKLKDDGDLRLKAGIGARTGSFAPQVLVGASYKSFFGGISYDIPVNGVQGAAGTQQYFELAVGYLGIINKTPEPDPIILCPRL